MQQVAFIGGAYTLKSVNVDCQRCVGLYPELNELGTGKNQEIAALVYTPGLKKLPIAAGLIPNTPNRCLKVTSKGQLFGVNGNKFWEFVNGDIVVRGTLETASGRVAITDNGPQVCIVDGKRGYIYTVASQSFAGIPSPEFPAPPVLVPQTATRMPSLGIGSGQWTGSSNASVDDGQFARVIIASDGSLGDGSASVLLLDHYKFSVAAGSVPTGIKVDVNCYIETTGGHGKPRMAVQLVKNGVRIGTLRYITQLPVLLGVISTGELGDLWSDTFSPEDLNADDFGVELSLYVFPELVPGGGGVPVTTATLRVDSASITLFYDSIEDSAPHDFPSAPIASLTGGPTTVDYLDGYFIVNVPGTREFRISALYDGNSWDALDLGLKEGQPDNLASLVVNNRELILLGDQTIEYWWNSGDADFPLTRIQGAFAEHGIGAAGTLVKISGSVIWLGKDHDGDAVIWRLQDHQLGRISTYPIEQQLKSYGDVSGATAWGYQKGGHSFYVLNAGGNTSWCYDTSTQLWHERQSQNAFGFFGRHRAENCAFYNGRLLVGDFENGNLYELSEDTLTDDGRDILRERSSPHISNQGELIPFSKFQLDMEAGIGLNSGQGSDPKVMFSYSNDGGHTWSNEKIASAGKIGEYRRRVIWNRLGSARDRVHRVRITDPVAVTMISALIQ